MSFNAAAFCASLASANVPTHLWPQMMSAAQAASLSQPPAVPTMAQWPGGTPQHSLSLATANPGLSLATVEPLGAPGSSTLAPAQAGPLSQPVAPALASSTALAAPLAGQMAYSWEDAQRVAVAAGLNVSLRPPDKHGNHALGAKDDKRLSSEFAGYGAPAEPPTFAQRPALTNVGLWAPDPKFLQNCYFPLPYDGSKAMRIGEALYLPISSQQEARLLRNLRWNMDSFTTAQLGFLEKFFYSLRERVTGSANNDEANRRYPTKEQWLTNMHAFAASHGITFKLEDVLALATSAGNDLASPADGAKTLRPDRDAKVPNAQSKASASAPPSNVTQVTSKPADSTAAAGADADPARAMVVGLNSVELDAAFDAVAKSLSASRRNAALGKFSQADFLRAPPRPEGSIPKKFNPTALRLPPSLLATDDDATVSDKVYAWFLATGKNDITTTEKDVMPASWTYELPDDVAPDQWLVHMFDYYRQYVFAQLGRDAPAFRRFTPNPALPQRTPDASRRLGKGKRNAPGAADDADVAAAADAEPPPAAVTPAKGKGKGQGKGADGVVATPKGSAKGTKRKRA